MSSEVNITLKEVLPIDDWLVFSKKHGIVFSPNTLGQSTFYKNQVEIALDGRGHLTTDPQTGKRDFENAKPPSSTTGIRVSSFFMSNLSEIAEVAKNIIMEYPCSFECDDELKSYLSEFQCGDTPLWGSREKNPKECRCEEGTSGSCGCAFGQCLKGMIV